MVIRTTQLFRSPASIVWPLLCDSQMDGARSLLFALGVPKPVRCRLSDGRGGVGAERECVSVRGVVHQRILEWSPEKRLSFRLERTDLPFWRHVPEMVDVLELVSTSSAVKVTRSTHLSIQGPLASLRKIVLYLGIKKVHRYVFRNWSQLAQAASVQIAPSKAVGSNPGRDSG